MSTSPTDHKPDDAAKVDTTTEKSATTTIFACKHPSGLLLRIFESDKYDVPYPGGLMRTETRAQAIGGIVRINGPLYPFGRIPNFEIVGGYALTKNIDSNFARKWMDQNKFSQMVRESVVFCEPNLEKIRAMCLEMSGVRSGLEPLNPEFMNKAGRQVPADVRWPMRTSPNLTTVETVPSGE